MPEAAGNLESVRALVRAAQARADRAGLLADEYAVLAVRSDNPHRALHRRMERAHRTTQQRHTAVVELHTSYLAALLAYRTANRPPAAQPPKFIGALAERLGAADLGLALFAGGQWTAATAATPRVRAAQDLEFTLAQGPVHDAAHSPVRADTPQTIQQRWPQFGPALTALGTRSVQAAAIAPAGILLGALLVLDRPPATPADALRQLADEVALSLLLAPEPADPDGALAAHPVLAETDDWAHIHQAAGMISVQQHCSVTDALDLLCARAYADDIPATELAEQVIQHRASLD